MSKKVSWIKESEVKRLEVDNYLRYTNLSKHECNTLTFLIIFHTSASCHDRWHSVLFPTNFQGPTKYWLLNITK
jgi:hypothetical protein